MKKFKCYATHIKYGYNASYMIVFAIDKRNAINDARQRSRLSDFNEYMFNAYEIN